MYCECVYMYMCLLFFFAKTKDYICFAFGCHIFLHWCGTIYINSLCLNAAIIILIMIAMFFIYKIQT